MTTRGCVRMMLMIAAPGHSDVINILAAGPREAQPHYCSSDGMSNKVNRLSLRATLPRKEKVTFRDNSDGSKPEPPHLARAKQAQQFCDHLCVRRIGSLDSVHHATNYHMLRSVFGRHPSLGGQRCG